MTLCDETKKMLQSLQHTFELVMLFIHQNLPTCMHKNHYFIATLLCPDFSRHTTQQFFQRVQNLAQRYANNFGGIYFGGQ